MSKIGNKNLVLKYLTQEDIRVIEDLTNSLKSKNITVACMGLYNHGKSSLLNALVGDIEGKTFKTADIRKTIKNKQYTHKGLVYVDTPGLNAQKNDDKRVMDAVRKSDINIFVHNVNTGEFVVSEVDFFQNIKRYWNNPKEFVERTIFVLSRIDEVNDDDDIAKAISAMSLQIKDIFDCEPTIVPVSAKRWTAGQIKDKMLLIKKSNIRMLDKTIKNLCDKYSNSFVENRKTRLNDKLDNTEKQLHSKIQTNKLEISKQKQAQKEYNDRLYDDIKKIENTLVNMYQKLGV